MFYVLSNIIFLSGASTNVIAFCSSIDVLWDIIYHKVSLWVEFTFLLTLTQENEYSFQVENYYLANFYA